jgi:hypothetical protein
MKFTFNRKARAVALDAIKKLERGAFASSILGAFSANPKVTAISAAILFVVCRIGETVIAGIEDDEKKSSKPARAQDKEKDDVQNCDSG